MGAPQEMRTDTVRHPRAPRSFTDRNGPDGTACVSAQSIITRRASERDGERERDAGGRQAGSCG